MQNRKSLSLLLKRMKVRQKLDVSFAARLPLVTLLPRPPLLIAGHVKKPLLMPSNLVPPRPYPLPTSTGHLAHISPVPKPDHRQSAASPSCPLRTPPSHLLCTACACSSSPRGREGGAQRRGPRIRARGWRGPPSSSRRTTRASWRARTRMHAGSGPRLLGRNPSSTRHRQFPVRVRAARFPSCHHLLFAASPTSLRRCTALLRHRALPLPLRRMASQRRLPASREATLPLPCPLHWGGAKPSESRRFLRWCLLLFPTPPIHSPSHHVASPIAPCRSGIAAGPAAEGGLLAARRRSPFGVWCEGQGCARERGAPGVGDH
jgi:hypothetical protein